MFKVESRLSDKGIVTVRLLSPSGKPVAAAAFPINFIDEMGAALMMSREKLEADGIIELIEVLAPGGKTIN